MNINAWMAQDQAAEVICDMMHELFRVSENQITGAVNGLTCKANDFTYPFNCKIPINCKMYSVERLYRLMEHVDAMRKAKITTNAEVGE